ncbi:accessory Sec system protein Asp1 [Leuconostoc holzapfelii]|uniref:Accessory Sec system protein Asp1 n=1 Tax=Leuconostoc holzapfelii TaxID=434464 RepID=A0A846Z8I3_9LACO|nr:accessory Sec system protein Asp1 [Leuconostoc holzapfelii]NKZ17646.1 accessory Sec system protein Asp1 [Leuconostoc holzapfelii]
MFYFIPAWYDERLTFDDTINQIKMFQSAEEPIQIIVPNYITQIEKFLHQQDLSSINYWAVFDDIQNTHHVMQRIISFEELNWPEGAEFVYTPFNIIVLVHDAMFARIKFGEDAYLSEITYYSGSEVDVEVYFDSRGFVSSIAYYVDGQKAYTDYLDKGGDWQIREYVETHEIIVNSTHQARFFKSHYRNMQELIEERLARYFSHIDEEEKPRMVVAADSRHNELVLNITTRPETVILSFFEPRNGRKLMIDNPMHTLSAASLMVFDTEDLRQQMMTEIGQKLDYPAIENWERKLHHLPPYDARLTLGTSQQFKNMYVLMMIKDLSEAEILELIDFAVDYTIAHKLVYVTMACADGFEKSRIEQQIRQKISEKFGVSVDIIADMIAGDNQVNENAEVEAENMISNDEKAAKDLIDRIQAQYFESEDAIIRELRRTRLIVDLSHQPDIFTQIAGISSGIPQINQIESPYVLHKKNGFILSNSRKLTQAMDYYLVGLSHWNEALVYSVQQIQKYSNGAIVKQWQDILEGAG